jgi:hypothetical protein
MTVLQSSPHHPITPNHSPNSHLFPIFLSSQLPIFPLYPLAAGGKINVTIL